MKREIKHTADGSTTIYLPDWDENYHSHHGAIQEAFHVFIDNGLKLLDSNEIRILEIGLGTGLNAFITLLEAYQANKKIIYTGVEKFPITKDEFLGLNYFEQLMTHYNNIESNQFQSFYQNIFDSEWECRQDLSPFFSLEKNKLDFFEIDSSRPLYNLIYFDAFGARVQPELWTEKLMQKMFDLLLPDGVFTTYAAKGSVRRALKSVGFSVEKRPGPPGKREMLVAFKS